MLGALIMLMFAVAWLINDLLGVETADLDGLRDRGAALLIVAAIAGLVAKKLFGEVQSPTPDMAIEELKVTKETLGKTP